MREGVRAMDSEEIQRCVALAELLAQHSEKKPEYEGCGERVRKAVKKPLLTGSDLELGQVIAAKVAELNNYRLNLAHELEEIEEAERISKQAYELEKSIDAFIAQTHWNAYPEVEAAHHIAIRFMQFAASMREDKRLGFETKSNPEAAFVENATARFVEIYSHYFGKVPQIRTPDDTNSQYSGRFANFINEISATTGLAFNVGSVRTETFRARERVSKSGG